MILKIAYRFMVPFMHEVKFYSVDDEKDVDNDKQMM